MQDEARHVTFGRMALREYYPHLSDAERAEREEFTVEALYFMRDRFNQAEVWMRSGLPVDKLMEYAYNSGAMQSFRTPPVHPHRADPQGDRPVRARRSRRRWATWA